MAKITSKTHVFSSAFDALTLGLGGSDRERLGLIREIVCRDSRTIRDWLSGARPCPRWAFELVGLTLDERYRSYEAMTGRYRALRSKRLREEAITRLSSALAAEFGSRACNDEFMVFEFLEVAEE